MNFSEALEALKNKKHVRQKDWRNKGYLHANFISDDDFKIIMICEGISYKFPWWPQYSNLTANDWEIVE